MGNKSIAYKIVLAQLGIALVYAAVCLAVWGKSIAVAALAGGAIGIITNLYLALRLFGDGVVRSAQQVLQRFYAAETVKFVLTLGLFALGLGVLKLNALPLLGGYGLTLVVYWLALLPIRPLAPELN
jgi:F0F1-type ATP synthase assembly protein I